MEEELMMEAKHLLKTEEEGGLLPFAQFSLDDKTVAHSVLGAAPSCLPACKPHKHPILINHFFLLKLNNLVTALHWFLPNNKSLLIHNFSLTEFFLC